MTAFTLAHEMFFELEWSRQVSVKINEFLSTHSNVQLFEGQMLQVCNNNTMAQVF